MMTWPIPVPEYSVSSCPMTRPASVAFIAAPGSDEVVSQSPGLMGPFSVETYTGTRPERATYTGRAGPWVSPSTSPGLVEITPNEVESYEPEDRRTPA